MKKFVSILGISLLSGICYSQQIQFSKKYNTGLPDSIFRGAEITGIFEIPHDGYFFPIGSYQFSTSEFDFIFNKVDSFGNILWRKFYGMPGMEYKPLSLLGNPADSTFIVSGHVKDLFQNKYNAMLTKLNYFGDTLWLKIHTVAADTNSQIWSVIKTSDGGYACVGHCSDLSQSASSENILLMKTDSSGNELWHKQYGGGQQDWAGGVVELPDKGFLIAGFTESFGIGLKDGYLVRADSLGNQLWQKTWGNNNDDIFLSIKLSQDGKYIMGGGGNFPYFKYWIMKVDLGGNVIWDKRIFGKPNGGEFYKTKELLDGSIVGTGGCLNVPGTLNQMGGAMKFSANGDSIWAKVYSDTLDGHGPDFFYDFIQTSDGGFLFAGREDPLSGHTGGWLVKTDSLGCFDTLFCNMLNHPIDSPTVVPIIKTPIEESFSIIPNPSNGDAIITYYIPGNSEKVNIYIYNISGKLVKEFYDAKESANIHSGELQPGIYFCKIISGEKINKILKMVIIR